METRLGDKTGAKTNREKNMHALGRFAFGTVGVGYVSRCAAHSI